MPDGKARRFAMEDEEGFRAAVAAADRAVALYRGRGCPYSAAFERRFEEAAADLEAWTFLVREVEHGGEGPVGDRLGIEVTPTVEAFAAGRSLGRLEAKPSIGLTARRFRVFLRGVEARA